MNNGSIEQENTQLKIGITKYFLLNLSFFMLLSFVAIICISIDGFAFLAFIPIIVLGIIGYNRYKNSRVDSIWKSFCWLFALIGLAYIFPTIIGVKYFKKEMALCKTEKEMKKTAWDMFFIGWFGLLAGILCMAIIGIFIVRAVGPKRYEVTNVETGEKLPDEWH